MDDIIENYGYIKYASKIEQQFPHMDTAKYSKAMTTDTLCETNHNLKIHISTTNYTGMFSWEISIVAETTQGNWVNLSYYSLQYTDLASMEKYENALIKMWEAACVR